MSSAMGGSARRPRLPKRSVIERLTKKGPECVTEMMGLLACFKDNNFNEARCQQNMRALQECVGRQVSASILLICARPLVISIF